MCSPAYSQAVRERKRSRCLLSLHAFIGWEPPGSSWAERSLPLGGQLVGVDPLAQDHDVGVEQALLVLNGHTGRPTPARRRRLVVAEGVRRKVRGRARRGRELGTGNEPATAAERDQLAQAVSVMLSTMVEVCCPVLHVFRTRKEPLTRFRR